MEYFDVLNSKGEKIGKTKLREEVHRDGDWHRAVHVWIMNENNELLIQKRSSNKDTYPDKWDISAAGHMEAGDDIITTAIKETKEELGIDIKEDDLEFFVSYKKSSKPNGLINNSFFDAYFVRGEYLLEDVKLQKEEVSEVKYIDYKELEKIVKSKAKNFVAHDVEYEKLFELIKKYEK